MRKNTKQKKNHNRSKWNSMWWDFHVNSISDIHPNTTGQEGREKRLKNDLGRPFFMCLQKALVVRCAAMTLIMDTEANNSKFMSVNWLVSPFLHNKCCHLNLHHWWQWEEKSRMPSTKEFFRSHDCPFAMRNEMNDLGWLEKRLKWWWWKAFFHQPPKMIKINYPKSVHFFCKKVYTS